MVQKDLLLVNKIGICDKCKSVNYKRLIEQIKNINKDVEFIVGCQNMCGIGRKNPFVILNHKPIIGDNEQDLINKIKDMLN